MNNPEIISREAVRVAGLTLHTSFARDRNKTEIPPFFHKVLEEKKLEQIPGRLNQNQLCIFLMKKDSPDFDYLMGVEINAGEEIPEHTDSMVLSGGDYVRMSIVKRGPEDVGRAFGYLYNEWMSGSGYVPSGAPAFIYYDEQFFTVFNSTGYAGNPPATVYIPVIKKL
ncbi:MAG: GyrI-like domain-containing protein [Bacteroidota bacterium]